MKLSTIRTMTLDGGVECLDFINSGYDRQKDLITERIHTYDDLLILMERLACFDATTIQSLRDHASEDKPAAEDVLNAARRARKLLYRLFVGLTEQPSLKLDRELLKEINRLFAEALQFKLLVDKDNQLQFSFQVEPAGLMAPIWRLVLSAHELLESGNLQYIKQCEGCAWLFLDKTKNHRKKWCSMESCGNSQKTKRYYQNKRQLDARSIHK